MLRFYDINNRDISYCLVWESLGAVGGVYCEDGCAQEPASEGRGQVACNCTCSKQ